MVLFEIHQKFKGHFLNELRVYFKGETKVCEKFTITAKFIFISQLMMEHHK